MPDYVYVLLIAVAAAVAAWRVSGRRAAERYRRALERLDADLRAGDAGAGGDPGSPAEVAAIRKRLAGGWMPVRGQSPEILSRLAQFLQGAVVRPLVQALHARGRGIRPRIQQALDGIEDIEFFAEAPSLELASADLVATVNKVAREYQSAFQVKVKLDAPETPLPCRIDVDAVQDAVYMILANAGHHGGGQPLEVTVRTAGNAAQIAVRDRGEGFSQEALARATEPFFSTVAGSLGLGLTHARDVIQAHGGKLVVGNHRGGGGEVVVVVGVGEG